MRRSNGAFRGRVAVTLTLWNCLSLSMNLSGSIMTRAMMLKGGIYAKMASDLTPSKVRTARRNCISAVAFAAMTLKVFESIETRIVRKRVLPRNAKSTINVGPRIQWKSGDLWIPVPSRPNHIHTIHFEIVTGLGDGQLGYSFPKKQRVPYRMCTIMKPLQA